MIVLDITWYLIEWKSSRDENKMLKEENTNLKAKIYDLQETTRKTPPAKDA